MGIVPSHDFQPSVARPRNHSNLRSSGLERVGEYPVRGFGDPIELFAYSG